MPPTLDYPFDSLGVDGALGALLIGYACSCVALGFFVAQILQYWSMYPEDKFLYKLLVLIIATLEFVDQGLISHALYFYVISNYNNSLVFVLKRAVWTIIVHAQVGTVIGTTVKLCFAVRVWRFSKHNFWVTGLIVVFTLSELGLATTYAVRCFQLGYFHFLPNLKVLATSSLGCGVFIDLLVASTLVYYLQRLKAGFRTATNLIMKLSIYAVSTGLVTSGIGLAILITYYFMPTNFIFMGLSFLLSKFYGISLLAALNTRASVNRNGSTANQGNNEPAASSISFTRLPSRTSSARRLFRNDDNQRMRTTLYSAYSATSEGVTMYRIPSMSPIPNFSLPLIEPVRYKESSSTVNLEPGSRFSTTST
ncbi:hypothetical protein Moror_1087 [Moniliophthora roreri MCA 2997]|uniref:DUF6534 domain-containing protein n=2 Tax=Moniliophthora roreri TaxID=221103 RepID=V2XK06_MONRO|nr:hypothetical protein Moror_1087 [Moniliophthora roreri MCA 2997]